MQKIAMLLAVFSIACGSGNGGGGADGGDAPAVRTMSYRYVTPDFRRVIGADVTVEAGAITEVESYGVMLPDVGPTVGGISLDMVTPHAGAMMTLDQDTYDEPAYQLSSAGAWEQVEAPPMGWRDFSCSRRRQMRAVDADVMVLLHTWFGGFAAGCEDGTAGDDFYVISRYERGMGWTESRPASLAAARAAVQAVIPGDYDYTAGQLLGYDDVGRTMTYLLFTPIGAQVVRANVDTWRFQFSGTLPCYPDSLFVTGNLRYWIQCQDEAFRYHCEQATCVRVSVEPGLPTNEAPWRYDRRDETRVGMSSAWVENFGLHSRLSFEATVAQCEPTLFPDPGNPANARIVTDAGELIYDTATGVTSAAPASVRDRIFGSECVSGSPTVPMFFSND
jgi:hypothetical protein